MSGAGGSGPREASQALEGGPSPRGGDSSPGGEGRTSGSPSPKVPPAAAALPIPPGTFRIDRDGTWRHEGQEVTHPGVLRNLYANLRVEGDRHYLELGAYRIPVEVANAPFVVIRAEPLIPPDDMPDGFRIYLSDGTEELLQPETLWLGPTGVPYCRVKGGRFTARFSLAAWLQLAEFLREDAETGEPELRIGGRRVPLRGGSGLPPADPASPPGSR